MGPPLSRRALLAGAGMAFAAPGLLHAAANPIRLVARSARAPLVGAPHPETDVWTYNGALPGPEIRLRQGDRLRVLVENRLDEGTTVHWHGVRVPHAMDGVPDLTQRPIAAAGGTFLYEFDLPDAGTYWYHPHQRSFEQVGRGLSGALIIEERAPIEVDRDVVWLLDDWRLLPDGSVSSDFGKMFDITHAGRIGNTVSLNGRVPAAFAVRAGERIRVRLINAANARIFGLEFRDHRPQVIAFDGQPVEPHEPEGGRIVLGPAMRADLVIDMTQVPGTTAPVIDAFYPRLAYKLVDLAYGAEPFRARTLDAPIALPANTMPEPDLARAERHEIVFTGGMMGGMITAAVHGRRMDLREMMQHGMAWAINGVAVAGHVHDPMLTLRRGGSYVLALRNDTAWHHPMHVHGHAFRVVARNGQPTARREWQDTVLLAPRESADIAFVADNPGDWMFHCHILEHQAGGMTGSIRVS